MYYTADKIKTVILKMHKEITEFAEIHEKILEENNGKWPCCGWAVSSKIMEEIGNILWEDAKKECTIIEKLRGKGLHGTMEYLSSSSASFRRILI